MGMLEAARAVGWGAGLVMLFVQPLVGLLILAVALGATIYLAREDPER
ncbi:MAG: hypothetical protein ACR2OI_08060 [Acidimicrobiia bacterium]